MKPLLGDQHAAICLPRGAIISRYPFYEVIFVNFFGHVMPNQIFEERVSDVTAEWISGLDPPLKAKASLIYVSVLESIINKSSRG